MYDDRRAQRDARRAYRRSMRRSRAWYGFPWVLVLVIAIVFWHYLILVPIVILVAIVIAFLISAGISYLRMSGYQMPPPQYPPSQFYQPYNQSQPPPQTPLYQPYDQGYQPPAQTYQEGGQAYPYAPKNDAAYDQPQVQYPEELPPMQQ